MMLYGRAMEDVEDTRHHSIALHALTIEYDDPENKQRVAAHAPVPKTSRWACWQDVLSNRA